MTEDKAKQIVASYESKDTHTMGEKMKYVKAKAFLRNAAILSIPKQ